MVELCFIHQVIHLRSNGFTGKTTGTPVASRSVEGAGRVPASLFRGVKPDDWPVRSNRSVAVVQRLVSMKKASATKVTVPQKSGSGTTQRVENRSVRTEQRPLAESPTPAWRVQANRVGHGLVVFLAVSYVLEKLIPLMQWLVLRPKGKGVAKTTAASAMNTTRVPLDTGLGAVSPTETTSKNAAGMRSAWAPPATAQNTSAADLVARRTSRKITIIGGKGGVGKSTMSAATAVRFADQGETTLIISTDPAHSLSDAFDQDVSGGAPVPVLSVDNLYAMEINPEQMKTSLRMMPDSEKLQMMSGMDMGLEDFDSLFETLPPGFDEAIALVEIMKLIQGDPAFAKFDRVVIDTAPTGHTLRLLSLPDFLDSFLGKILTMKNKLGNVMNQFKGMLGGANDMQSLDSADIDELKRSMNMVRALLRDPNQTEFIVATIPTMMSVAESERLVKDLNREKIPCRHVFVNMVQPPNEQCNFCKARRREHETNYKYIERVFRGLEVVPVKYFEREVRGAPALRAMAGLLFASGSAESISQQETRTASAPDVAASGAVEKTEVQSANTEPQSVNGTSMNTPTASSSTVYPSSSGSPATKNPEP